MLGAITIIALVVALLVQPLVGQWSDRTRSRWGRRIPYLAVGTAGVSMGLIVTAAAGNLVVLVLGAMLVSGFANTVQSAWQALIPDRVQENQHGTAAGVKTSLELIGIVAGVAIVGYTLSRGNLWGAPLTAIGLFVIIFGVTYFLLRKQPPQSLPPSSSTNL